MRHEQIGQQNVPDRHGSHSDSYGLCLYALSRHRLRVPAYYDGFYGPYWDGYWGADGVFFFYDVHDHRFHRDDGHHFRHDQSPGFAGIPHRNVARGMPANPSHAFGGAVRGGGARERRG